MISIILPVYKSERTIKKCLESILKQSKKDFEVVIVYKEGNDKTLSIINSFNDSRIRIVFQNVNSGPGGARNLGIESSSGEYLGFVEADDCIDKDFYKNLYQRIIHDESDIAWGEIFVEGKRIWSPHKSNSVKTDFYGKYELVKNGASFDKLFKSSLIKDHSIKFSENIRFEDNSFLLKSFYYSRKISLVKNAIYYYNPGPWSDEYKTQLKRYVVTVAKEMMDFANSKHFTYRQLRLLQRKIVRCFASSFILEPDVYYPLAETIGNPLFLKIIYLKKQLKNKIKKLTRK